MWHDIFFKLNNSSISLDESIDDDIVQIVDGYYTLFAVTHPRHGILASMWNLQQIYLNTWCGRRQFFLSAIDLSAHEIYSPPTQMFHLHRLKCTLNCFGHCMLQHLIRLSSVEYHQFQLSISPFLWFHIFLSCSNRDGIRSLVITFVIGSNSSKASTYFSSGHWTINENFIDYLFCLCTKQLSQSIILGKINSLNRDYWKS